LRVTGPDILDKHPAWKKVTTLEREGELRRKRLDRHEVSYLLPCGHREILAGECRTT
jgi:hypothetical protein